MPNFYKFLPLSGGAFHKKELYEENVLFSCSSS